MGISCSDGGSILTATTPPHLTPKATLATPSKTLDKPPVTNLASY
jgi:hypothetical protein